MTDLTAARALADAADKAAEGATNLLKEAEELRQYTSYAEIVGGISVNRPYIRKHCDGVLAAVKLLPDDENFDPTMPPLSDMAATIRDLCAEVERLRDALIWCSGSADFGDGGIAREGWMKICKPLLEQPK